MRIFFTGTIVLISTSVGMTIAIGVFNAVPGWWIFIPVILGGILQLIGFWLIRPSKINSAFASRIVTTGKTKITVLTVGGEPSFIVAGNVSAASIDDVIKMTHGTQPNGCPHNWRGDPVVD